MAVTRVLSVDDNRWIGDSIERFVRTQPGLEWGGWLSSVAALLERAGSLGEAIVLLDVDMPGEDPLGAAERLSREAPQLRVIFLSGHLSAALLDRAFDAGAWGYISKTDDTAALVRAIRRVSEGEVAFGVVPMEGFAPGV